MTTTAVIARRMITEISEDIADMPLIARAVPLAEVRFIRLYRYDPPLKISIYSLVSL